MAAGTDYAYSQNLQGTTKDMTDGKDGYLLRTVSEFGGPSRSTYRVNSLGVVKNNSWVVDTYYGVRHMQDMGVSTIICTVKNTEWRNL